MEKTFNSPQLGGTIRAISSKSEAHRQLICAAFGEEHSTILCTDTNADIDATISCLNSLGADIKPINNGFEVTPIKQVIKKSTLCCGESGSTLRFLIPIIAAVNSESSFFMEGRLPERPLSPLYELLEKNNIPMSKQGENPFFVGGTLTAGDYSIEGNVSSQFISGLLFALCLKEDNSTLTLTGKIESAPYIEMTLLVLKHFGAEIKQESNIFYIKGIGKFKNPETSIVGGDWSNAAFFLVAGALSKTSVKMTGLDINSAQGDKEILNVISKMGGVVKTKDDSIEVCRGNLHGIELDASQIPDLVPIICVLASVACGKTRIYNAGRLRIKESDRIESVCEMIKNLGGEISSTYDEIFINGKDNLLGGVVNSYNDHRIAMSAAIASTVCKNPVTIQTMQAINKSYPKFIEDFDALTKI